MPKVPCYQCGQPFEPSPDALKAWVESDRTFDPTDWVCPACSAAEERRPLTLAEAMDLMPDGDRVITGTPIWGGLTLQVSTNLRSDLIAAIEKYGAEFTGPLATHSGFGMAIRDEHGWLFIRTKKGVEPHA